MGAGRARSQDRRVKLRWLNPETIMYIAYAMYVAEDKTVEGSLVHKEAVRVMQKYLDQTAQPGTRDEEYLIGVRAVAVSYVRAIQRLRRIMSENLKEAEGERDNHTFQRMGMRINSGVWRIALRLGLLVLIGALGSALALVFAPFIPQDFGQTTGKVAPSAAGGIVFSLIGLIISSIWSQYVQVRISNRFSRRVNAAWELFIDARESEYDQHLFDLCELWKGYTGHKYKVVSSIHTVLAHDKHLLRQYFREQKLASRGQLQILTDSIRSFLERRSRRKKALMQPTG